MNSVTSAPISNTLLLGTALAGTALLLALLVTPFLHVVPAWDAGWYLACLLNAVEVPFALTNFNCCGHISAAYTVLLAIGQYVSYGSAATLNLTNLALWILASFAIALAVKRASGDRIGWHETIAVGCVVLFNPTGLSHAFHLNTDFGVMVFGAITIAALLYRWVLLAAIAGTAMCFTKEVGVAYYVGLWGLYVTLLNPQTSTKPIVRVFKAAIAFIPLAIFGLRTVVRYIKFPDQPLIFTYEDVEKLSTAQMVFDLNPFDPTFRFYLADLFVLNFHWLLTLVLIAAFAHYVCRGRSSSIVNDIMKHRELIFVVCAVLGAVYLVTRVRPYNHVRYLLTAFPAIVILAFASYRLIIPSVRVRAVSMAVLAVLWIFSSLLTIDPVSRALYGTFAFGQRSMLNISSAFFHPNPMRQHYNRDEIVYNLEFLRLHQLTDAVFADLKLDGRSTIMGSRDSILFWPGMVDEATRQRVARRAGGVFRAHYIDRVEIFKDVVERPEVLHYLEFPNMLSPTEYDALKQWYEYEGVTVYSIDGYEMRVLQFRKRAA